MNLNQLWRDIKAAREEVGNRMCQYFDMSLKENGPRKFFVTNEDSGEILWLTTVTGYTVRNGRRPLVEFPVVDKEIGPASICERKAERDVVLATKTLYVDDQAAVRPNGCDDDERLYNVLIRTERELHSILWPPSEE